MRREARGLERREASQAARQTAGVATELAEEMIAPALEREIRAEGEVTPARPE